MVRQCWLAMGTSRLIFLVGIQIRHYVVLHGNISSITVPHAGDLGAAGLVSMT